jgi:predicted lipoprotein with Yx(FWY)xxD motif
VRTRPGGPVDQPHATGGWRFQRKKSVVKRVTTVLVGTAAVAALAAGCASSTKASPAPSSSSTAPASSAPASGSAQGAAVVKTASSPEGQILVDGSGRTLYLFQADTTSTSTCNGACATAWPPDTTTGAPTGSGVNTALLGTGMRADHASQVTYKGHPLYYFADDTQPGATNGQGADAFGGKWYVVSPSGAAITTAAPTTAPSTAPSTSGGSGGGGYGY